MKIAIVQTAPAWGEKARNLEAALALMEKEKADLYVLPELFTTGYIFAGLDELLPLAEAFPGGPTHQALATFSEDRKSAVVYGFAEKAGGRVYNSAALVAPQEFAGLYRKVHLYDREKLCFAPGDLGFRVFDSPWGKIGIMICFDWYFPESARTLTLRGAELIAHPANLVMPYCPDTMPVRCRENRVFAATANRVGTEARGECALTFIGQSQLTAPEGTILHRASPDQEEIFLHEIDPAQAQNKQVNLRNHILNDRRPEFYEPD
jgi:predicted amidohydrolase